MEMMSRLRTRMKNLRCRRCVALNSRFSQTTSEGSEAGPTLRACRFLSATFQSECSIRCVLKGKARQGKAGQGRAGQGRARQGRARLGKGKGKARQGKAKQGNPQMKPDKAQGTPHQAIWYQGQTITKQGSGVVHKEMRARPCQSGWCTNSTGQGRGMDVGSYSQQHWHSR